MERKCKKCFNFSGVAFRDGVEIVGLLSEDEFERLKKISSRPCRNQIDIHETVVIPECKPDCEQINQMNLEVCLIDAWISPSERKLLIKGIVKQKIIYTALFDDQPVHTVENKFPFSHFIDIDEDHHHHYHRTHPRRRHRCELNDKEMAAIANAPENFIALAIEDAFIQKVNGREMFKNLIISAFILDDLIPRKHHHGKSGNDKHDADEEYDD